MTDTPTVNPDPIKIADAAKHAYAVGQKEIADLAYRLAELAGTGQLNPNEAMRLQEGLGTVLDTLYAGTLCAVRDWETEDSTGDDDDNAYSDGRRVLAQIQIEPARPRIATGNTIGPPRRRRLPAPARDDMLRLAVTPRYRTRMTGAQVPGRGSPRVALIRVADRDLFVPNDHPGRLQRTTALGVRETCSPQGGSVGGSRSPLKLLRTHCGRNFGYRCVVNRGCVLRAVAVPLPSRIQRRVGEHPENPAADSCPSKEHSGIEQLFLSTLTCRPASTLFEPPWTTCRGISVCPR